MMEYIGLGIVAASLIFAVSAAVMAWRLKQRLDVANSRVALEQNRRDERRKIYQEVIVMLESAIASVNRGHDYEFDRLFDDLSPQLHLNASEEVNSSFIEVCLLLENWTAMKEGVEKVHRELQHKPDNELILEPRLKEQKKQAEDAHQLFKHKFNKNLILF